MIITRTAIQQTVLIGTLLFSLYCLYQYMKRSKPNPIILNAFKVIMSILKLVLLTTRGR